ncbi:hypothetical protein imdm_611 [gamma proteobacterium IMCC2047]|nr:hypothetical protein imdm_611 [gamma proteobacterium IMCC2047]
MSNRYKPPVQAGFGQFFDSIFILVLVYLALMAPLVLDFSDADDVTSEVTVEEVAPTWESLGQNETMQGQWEKLDISVEEAAVIINDKFDYSIDPMSLLFTLLVLVGYWIFMIKVSDKEYREVINEKFGKRE